MNYFLIFKFLSFFLLFWLALVFVGIELSFFIFFLNINLPPNFFFDIFLPMVEHSEDSFGVRVFYFFQQFSDLSNLSAPKIFTNHLINVICNYLLRFTARICGMACHYFDVFVYLLVPLIPVHQVYLFVMFCEERVEVFVKFGLILVSPNFLIIFHWIEWISLDKLTNIIVFDWWCAGQELPIKSTLIRSLSFLWCNKGFSFKIELLIRTPQLLIMINTLEESIVHLWISAHICSSLRCFTPAIQHAYFVLYRTTILTPNLLLITIHIRKLWQSFLFSL